MKKILSLGIASAVLALTAVSASAGVVVKTEDTITKGATIKVTFVTDSEIAAGGAVSFKVVASGAKLEKSESTVGMIGESTGTFGAFFMGAAPANTVLLTQTYTVTADEGTVVSINATDLDGFGAANSVTAITETVKAGTTSSDTPSGDNSGSSTTTPSGTDSNSSTTTDPGKNPGTGVALAVFPAVIAGAAVVVAKKKRG